VLHVVGPVYRDLTRVEQAEFRPPDFNSTFVCNYFFVNQVQGGCGVYCNVGYFPSGNPPVKFTETGTTFGMSFDVEQFKTIFKRMVKSAG
jgi:hypothetical protein